MSYLYFTITLFNIYTRNSTTYTQIIKYLCKTYNID